jgi:Cu/Ag efflux pump CusA
MEHFRQEHGRESTEREHFEVIVDAAKSVQDVNQIVESAIGGNTIAMTVEGRERYPTSVRYARDFRSDLDTLKRILVPTPTGAQVPHVVAGVSSQGRRDEADCYTYDRGGHYFCNPRVINLSSNLHDLEEAFASP